MMKLIKENLGPTLIILFASALIIMAAWPVENSAWAEGIRTERSNHGPEGGEGEGEGEAFSGEGEDAPPRIAMIFLPMVKVAILMGIGGLFTALGLWIARLVTGNRKRVPKGRG